MTTSEPALPRPLAEGGTIRRLGAEILEYPIADDDAIVGHRVRDLGLPRDAVVNVIVRDDQAIPPRGTTRLRAGDRLHVLIRQESARELYDDPRPLALRPDRPPAAPAREPLGREAVFSTGAWREQDGDAARPDVIGGRTVIEQLRIRRDEPGGAVGAGGRPLRGDGAAVRDGHAARRLRLGAAPDAAGGGGREGVAADGHRGAGGGSAGVGAARAAQRRH